MNQEAQLKLYNSMTRRKDTFVPSNESCLSWYNCGPTVYDASHMGHARSYVSFDIIRRVLTSYFNYNISYAMNITDIDDKIIFRARRNYLIDNYISSSHPIDRIIEDANEAVKLLEDKIHVSKYLDLLTITEKLTAQQNKVNTTKDGHQLKELEKIGKKLLENKAEILKDPQQLAMAEDNEKLATLAEKKMKLKESNIALTNDPNKLAMFVKNKIKADNAIQSLSSAAIGQSDVKPDSRLQEFFSDIRDPLSELLDKKFGTSVNDHEIFARLARHWENDFNDDMKALNVLPADAITRVSEYVPEVIEFVQGIIKRNYGYVSNGSVYFDTVAFNNSPDHRYGKLLPEAIGDLNALAEGEGELSIGDDRLREKRSPNDFALWKCSKPGEPFWDSPWGKGRPGWHIECSVMASAILGKSLDIHSGGVDLKFPHHENEIAQVEEALSKYSARQLRLAFLSHPWNTTMDYSENMMSSTMQTEKLFLEFFLNVKDIDRVYSAQTLKEEKWNSAELELEKGLCQKQNNIHRFLCDSINTPDVMKELKELINQSNSYIASKRSLKQSPNARLLKKISRYIVKMLRIFGVTVDEIETTIGFPSYTDNKNINKENTIMPYLTVLAEFRAKVRDSARLQKVPDLLNLCDDIRNDILPELGVRLEDLEDGPAIKLVDRAILLKEKENRLMAIEEKKRKKEEAKRKQMELKAQQESKMKISPKEMFLNQSDKYSQFDEKGIPTHDHEGTELSGKQKKKLLKQYEAQKKLFLEYQTKQAPSN
ncbi:Cysteine--tRNA ligase, cytoplasmic [Trichoplax sp. H2]|nr:Cysteine--tRNA ligase, cytoplasmic [Trichoplax sp. H2]|eukprot:RDD44623.1 Cysteine--tRNA ligase, cytoplasmic [Trichoplax sp. H2]